MKHHYSWLSPKAKKRRSSIHHCGIFACAPVKKDEVICVFGGQIMSADDYKKLSPKRAAIVDKYGLGIENGFFLIMPFGELLEGDDFFNHSCNPNAGFSGQITLIAMKQIQKGEEITFDYAMCESDPNYRIRCRCGIGQCRKEITGNDWKKSSLQKKYMNYFSYPIQKKIGVTKRS